MDISNKIKLSPLISDGMILQRNSPVQIWGKSKPLSKIKLTFLNVDYNVSSDQEGNWQVNLDALEHGGPYKMKIESDCGDRIVINDILIGDVWVLGGQSNMETPVSRTLDLFEEEVKGVNYPNIRKFSVPERYDFHGPIDELSAGNWEAVKPETVYDFSAVGYFFAKKIYRENKIPIGLIHTAVGGTPAEAWMSEEALEKFTRFHKELDRCKDDAYIEETKRKEESDNNRWYKELYIKDPGVNGSDKEWFREEYNDSDWDEMELPRRFTDTPLEDLKGSVWFRKEIMIPEDLAGKKAKLVLGTIVDGDYTYLNSEQVGTTGYLYPPRRYEVREGLLKPGKNILTVRVILTSNIGAFVTDMPYFLQVGDKKIPLSGRWKYKKGAIMDAQGPTTFFQYKPTGVYNGMIYPLRRYSIKGALWYQGESNTDYPHDYRQVFEAVIKNWRDTWNLGDFPFIYVQLANYCPWKEEPAISGWAEVREKQRQALEIPNTGMVVSIDVGQYNELHPWDKKTVGERLALWAKNMVYEGDLVYSGPIYDRCEKAGDKIRIYFKHVGSGLVVKGDELKSFTICGKDNAYVEAKAIVDGDTIIVYGEGVDEAVGVRYAWADNPEDANLYNKEGLPASPFMATL